MSNLLLDRRHSFFDGNEFFVETDNVRLKRLPSWVVHEFFGGGGKTQQSTSTTTVPPEVLARYNQVNDIAAQAAQTPFQQYSTDPNAFVAPMNATQNAGVANTNASANEAQPAFAAGIGMTAQGSGPTNVGQLTSADISKYMNPFVQSVVTPAAQLLNQQQQSQMSGQTGNAIQSGAFGGDRAGIAAANLAGQQSLAFANAINPLYESAYTSGLGAAQQQQGFDLSQQQANLAREQAGGAQIANLGAGAQTAGLQGGAAQLAAGQVGQATQQAGLTALYNQFEQQQSYPFQVAQFQANIAEGTGANSGSTTTTTSPAPFFSDERLKEEIEDIGRTHDGQKIIKFRYKGNKGPKQIGLSAQDVEKHHPEAVGLAGGYKTVDYDEATKDAASMGGFVEPGLGARRAYAGGGYAPVMFDPNQNGFYGGMPGGIPGNGHGYVPAPVQNMARMQTPQIPQHTNPTGMSQVMGTLKDAQSLSSLASGAKNAGSDVLAWLNKPDAMTQDNNPASQASDELLNRKRGGLVGYSSGGMPYSNDNGLDIPDDAPSAKLVPAGAGTGTQSNNSSSNLGDLASLSKLPGLAKSAASGIGDLTSGLGAATSAPMELSGAAAAGGESAADLLPLIFLKRGGKVYRAPGGRTFSDYAENIAQNTDVADLDPTFADRVQDLQQDASDEGIPTHMISGYRSTPQQAGLYAKYLAGGNLAAPPGHSMHELGLAADIPADDPNQQSALVAMAKQPWRGIKAGADFGDPSHFQMADAGNAASVNSYSSKPPSAADVPASRAIGLAAPSQTDDGQNDNSPALLDNIGNAASGVGDWFSKNQNWLVPVLTGLGTMASSPSRYLGSALLQGLGGGAQAYNRQQLQQSQIAKNTLGLMQQRFTPTTDHQNNLAYFDQVTGKIVTPEQRSAIVGNIASPTAILQPTNSSGEGNPSPTNPSASSTTVASAKPIQPDSGASPDSDHPEDAIYARVESLPQIKNLKDTADRYDAQADNLLEKAQRLAGTGPQGEAAAARLTAQAGQNRSLAQQYRQNMMTQREQLAAPEIAKLNETNKKQIEQKYAAGANPEGAKYLPGPGGDNSNAEAPAANSSAAAQKMTIDPKTAEPQTVSPPPPPGGGFPIPKLPAGAKMTEIGEPAKELAKTDAEFNKTMLGNAPVVQQGIERLRALGQAYKTFQSGAGQDTMHAIAAYATAYGRPDIAEKALGGGPQATAAYEWVKKEGVNLTLDTLSAKQPKFAQQEFKALAADGVPNTTNRPEANQRLVAETLGTLLQQQKFQNDWATRGKPDGWASPSAYYQQWQIQNPLDGFVVAAQRQIGNFRGSSLPPTKEWVEGSTYVAPVKPSPELKKQLDVMGVKPGQVFRYNGRNSPVEPLQDEDALKAYQRQ